MSTVTSKETNELIELPSTEKLRVRLLFNNLLKKTIQAKPDDTLDYIIKLVESEYADLLFYNLKLEKDIENLKRQIK